MLPDFIGGAAGAVAVAYVPDQVLPMFGFTPTGFVKHGARGLTAWLGSYVAQMVGGARVGWAFFIVGNSVALLGVLNDFIFAGALPALSYYPSGIEYYPEGLSQYLNPAQTLEGGFGQEQEYAYAWQ